MITYVLLSLLFAVYIANYVSTRRKYPPGPLPLPLFGNLFHFFFGMYWEGGAVHLLQKWTMLYGPVFTIWIGPVAMVMVTGYEAAQESMIKKGAAFVDRQYIYLLDITRQGRGILVSNGQEWQEQRRFTLQTLRDFGLGKNVMQERVLLELDYRMSLLDADIQSAGGKMTWNPLNFTELTVGNIINRILFSERFTKEKEQEFFRIKRALEDQLSTMSIVDPLLRDWNRDWPVFRTRYQAVKGAEEPVVEFIKKQIEQKKATVDSGYSEDYVEAYLAKMKSGDCSPTFDEKALIATLMDLWIAGQETTAGTVHWGIAYLVRFPEVFKKLQKEVDEVTRRNRPLGLADKTATPYLNSVIQEIFRVSTIFPINLGRQTTEDVTVAGCPIPKGTGVGLQMSAIMNSDKHFKNPKEFNPDRFLTGESDQFVLPFSLGKRACPGESLARTEIYLILGNMALNYNLESIEGKLPRMDAKQEMGAMRKPFPFECIVSKRN